MTRRWPVALLGALLISVVAGACALSARTPHDTSPPADPATGSLAGAAPSAGVTQRTTTLPRQIAPAARATALPTPFDPFVDDPGAIALVNAQPISVEAWEAALAQVLTYLEEPSGDALGASGLHDAVLDMLIEQALIEQAAAALGVSVTAEAVGRELDRLRSDGPQVFDQWVEASGLTPEALAEQVRGELLTRAVRDAVTAATPLEQEQVRLRHIMVDSEAEALQIRRRLDDGESFIGLARSHSIDAGTREGGGDLGFLPRGLLPPAFEAMALSLRPGKWSGVIESESGWHILLLVEIDPERPVSAEHWPAVQEYAFRAWLDAQRERAVILRR